MSRRGPVITGRGAGGSVTPQNAAPLPLEHERDVALAQAALRKVSARLAAKRIAGEATDIALRNMFVIAKGLLRDLGASKWSTLTQRQREICASAAGLDKIPPAQASIPDVLRVLPKAPPGRRNPQT